MSGLASCSRRRRALPHTPSHAAAYIDAKIPTHAQTWLASVSLLSATVTKTGVQNAAATTARPTAYAHG